MAGLAAIALMTHVATAFATAQFKIVTASSRGTYIEIGRDLAKYVAPAADIDLEVLSSAGSAENVRRLRFEAGVKLALVQSDVYQAFLDQAAAGNAEAAKLIAPLRVILPLYSEEIYFVVRADSPLSYIHEIAGARINVGPLGSGTALSTTTVYRQMFGEPIATGKETYLSNEDALVALISNKDVDVVAIIAGQPAKLLADMTPESRKFVKLLKFDARHKASEGVLKTYFAATIRAESYPNLLSEDIPGLAIRAYLVTYDYSLGATQHYFGRFAKSLCNAFDTLQTKGHPKWREVKLELPELGRGWAYYGPTARPLRACIASQARPRAPPAKVCTQQELVLGLCR